MAFALRGSVGANTVVRPYGTMILWPLSQDDGQVDPIVRRRRHPALPEPPAQGVASTAEHARVRSAVLLRE